MLYCSKRLEVSFGEHPEPLSPCPQLCNFDKSDFPFHVCNFEAS